MRGFTRWWRNRLEGVEINLAAFNEGRYLQAYTAFCWEEEEVSGSHPVGEE